MHRIREQWHAIALVVAFVVTVHAGEGKTSKPFDQGGVVVDVHAFFHAASDTTAADFSHRDVAGLALATANGLYAFLETPHNQTQLAQTGPGTVVRVQGKLLEEGALLHIDTLEKTSEISLDLDLAGLRNDSGREVVLSGTNKCQCGLDVADLPHNCTLGHLHHLEADDGQTYHYLQLNKGKEIFLGRDSHFKNLEVRGRVFPGHYLLVEEAKIY